MSEGTAKAKGGRKPIGKRPMTAAERQARVRVVQRALMEGVMAALGDACRDGRLERPLLEALLREAEDAAADSAVSLCMEAGAKGRPDELGARVREAFRPYAESLLSSLGKEG